MTILAESIAASICNGKRIDTLRLRYPKFIHGEFMTHRVFSRNASSSRAIPVERMIEDIKRDTAMPIHWGKNQAGMQAREEHRERIKSWDFTGPINHPTLGEVGGDSWSTLEAWNFARDNAIKMALAFHKAGYHTQIVNRLLEPFLHINVVVTAPEWDNFFELRDHEDAQPEIRALAQAIKKAMASRDPVELKFGQWHAPFVTGVPDEINPEECYYLLVQSVARCARVSYLTHDGKPSTLEEDETLFKKLVGSRPLHASPLEHQATPDPSHWYKHQWANFRGWRQFRKIHELGRG